MFCSKCGTKIEEGADFCQNCGASAKEKKVASVQSQPDNSVEEILYYGQDWTRAKHFAVASLPYFDILVTKKNFYLLQFPKTHGATWGLIIGIFFSLVGAIVGVSIGNSSDRKKRRQARDTWLSDNRLTSENYKSYIFVKIAKDKLKNHLSLEKKHVIVTDGEETVVLKKNKKEFTGFNTFVESYVL